MNKIKIKNKEFQLSIPTEQINKRITEIADSINADMNGKEVIFLAILNGAFMFASDLIKKITLRNRISFLKLASYEGAVSTGKVKQLIGINEVLKGYSVVIIEDIVDTGRTLDSITKQLQGFEPDEVKIASMLYKPEAYKGNLTIDYIGFEIPDAFVVGYGLDYDGYGRNLEGIYTLIEKNKS
jgi:hypoxanthine phosphoribosyltransferase